MIEEIRKKVRQNQFEFSQHTVDQSILRQISVQELRDPNLWIDFKLRRIPDVN